MCADKVTRDGGSNGNSQSCKGYIATIRISCIDNTGIVAAVAQLLQGYGVNSEYTPLECMHCTFAGVVEHCVK